MSRRAQRRGRALRRRYGHMGLIAAPYSTKSLADADDKFFQLQPYEGGWIVTDHGVHVGSVKKLKGGWKKDGYPVSALDRAIRLLEESGK